MTATITDTAHATATWMTEGACRREDPDLFFPISASKASVDQIEQAIAVCRRCGVQSECLSYALVDHINHGIWGGRTEQERQALIRSRRKRRLPL
jgi:WhiB family transcriptional regulator, redox-sensing transcriptional regulator